jgi:hypothetical protein
MLGMKKYVSIFLPILGGLLLIGLGVLLLLDNFGLINMAWELVVGPVLGICGLLFIAVFIFDHTHWWALIPGFSLIGIGGMIFVNQYFGTQDDTYGFAFLMAAIGLAFWLIYISHTKHWWAIIPGGVLWSLAAASLVDEKVLGNGTIFFLGLALTFFLVYILPKPMGKMRWALIPAGVLGVLGVATLTGANSWLKYVWPGVVLTAGVLLLIWGVRKRS